MNPPQDRVDAPKPRRRAGIDAFLQGVSELAWLSYIDSDNSIGAVNADRFIREIGERYANIRLGDLTKPRRFLGQMAGAPPLQLGREGFRSDLLDDYNPARHYTALLIVGFYVPMWLATIVLYLWEVAGFIRYRGQWSWPDIRSGMLGIRHGALVRKYGPVVLPGLIAAQLAENSDDWLPEASSTGLSTGSDAKTLRAS